MANIKIISWNPQGLHKDSKRTQAKCDFLENEYNHNDFDVLALLETHHKTENTLPHYIQELKISHNYLDSLAPENDSYLGNRFLWFGVIEVVSLEGRALAVRLSNVPSIH